MNSDNVFSFDNRTALTFKHEAFSFGQDSYDFSRRDVCKRADGKAALHEVSDLGLWISFGRHG